MFCCLNTTNHSSSEGIFTLSTPRTHPRIQAQGAGGRSFFRIRERKVRLLREHGVK